MLLRPIRFMSTTVRDASKIIYARIHKPINIPNLNPDSCCYDNREYPQTVAYTVAPDKFAEVVDTLKMTVGVSSVNGEKTDYGKKVEPEFIYRQHLGGLKAF